MPDLLVKLYHLPPYHPVLATQEAAGISIRRVISPEKHVVLPFVRHHFSEFWVSECDVAFSRLPASCFIAIAGKKLIGFACYDTTSRGFFGPTGVSEAARGRGTGTALLLACLHDMRNQGYGYAIIGDAGPVDYYARTVGAQVIEESEKGVYKGMLRPNEQE